MTRTLLIILAVITLGCQPSADNRSVPRRDAYPRPVDYGTEMAVVDSVPLHFLANAQVPSAVEHRANSGVWLNISYPAYGACVYVTFTPADRDRYIDIAHNRTERFALNTEGNESLVTEFESEGGYHVMEVYAPGAVSTPLQMVAASDSDPRWVVSGVAFFDVPRGASVDSLVPSVAAVRRDMLEAFRALK